MTIHSGGIDYAHELAEGLRLFDSGRYWETHEILERAWLRQRGIDRHFLAGVIQLAAALHKTRAGGLCAGRRIYARALTHLAWAPDTFRGLDVRAMERICLDALTDPRAKPLAVMADEDAVPR